MWKPLILSLNFEEHFSLIPPSDDQPSVQYARFVDVNYLFRHHHNLLDQCDQYLHHINIVLLDNLKDLIKTLVDHEKNRLVVGTKTCLT